MKLVIFPGTFNPIHIGHLIIAQYAREQCLADKVLFVTANIPPHRSSNIANAIHRHEMVKLACDNNKYFEASDIELKREGPSYTFDTLLYFKQKLKTKGKIYFIIGCDALGLINTWNYADEIINMCHFLLAPRPGSPSIDETINITGFKNVDYEMVNSPLIQISSTIIRDRIANNKPIDYLVCNSVKNYLINNNLYKI